jgi:hypothetical protein
MMKKVVTALVKIPLITCTVIMLGAEPIPAQETLVNSNAAVIVTPQADDESTIDPVGAERASNPSGHITLFRKPPYLIYPGVNTQMQVLWQLNAADTCAIEWGTDTLYTDGYGQTEEYNGHHQHTCVMTGLMPGTKYHYRVTAGGEAHTGSFYAAPEEDDASVTFFAYGDTRTYTHYHNQVAAAMIAAYTQDEGLQSIVLSVGDLVGAGDSESDWDNQFFNPYYPNIQRLLATMPYQSCMGNHEQSGALFVRYFPYPFVSGRYWSFDYGPVHFTVVDQYTSYGPGSAQLAWIENDLAATDRPWKILYLHEPGWSAGSHSNNTYVQNYIQPLCRDSGVSIVFAGHNHYYARAVVDGIHHVTTGGGGAPLYAPDPGFPYVVASAMIRHFCTVELDGDMLRFRAIDTAGAVIDSFTITPAVGVDLTEAAPPVADFVLHPAYPNPCNPTTTISFALPVAAEADLAVYNVTGQKVRTLADGRLEAGHHTVTWDGRDDRGREAGSGLYICRLRCGRQVRAEKILLLR